jgi:hypothetical protein
MSKPLRYALEWFIVITIVVGISSVFLSVSPQAPTPSELFLPLPDDISKFNCPAGYIDPEFVSGGIVCVRNDYKGKL